MFDKYLRLPQADSRRKLVDKLVPTRLMTRHDWRAKTVEKVEVDLPRDMFTAPWHTHNWNVRKKNTKRKN